MASNRISFVDGNAGSDYDFAELNREPLGTTEVAVLAVVQGLSQLMSTTVWQAGRRQSKRFGGIKFRPYVHSAEQSLGGDYVVAIDNAKILPKLRETNPKARIFLWLHDVIGHHQPDLAQTCLSTGTTLIATSKFHRDYLKRKLKSSLSDFDQQVEVECIYNPVVIPPLRPLPYDEDKLVHVVTDSEGLKTVLDRYQYCRQAYPMLQLHLLASDKTTAALLSDTSHGDGVINFGFIRRIHVLEHLASAFCLFSPQKDRAPFFDQAFADANALSVPVIAADIGAADEIIQGCRSQVLQDISAPHVLATIGKWRREGKPLVRMRKQFRLESVSANWMRVLLDSRRTLQEYRGAVIRPQADAYPEARRLRRH